MQGLLRLALILRIIIVCAKSPFGSVLLAHQNRVDDLARSTTQRGQLYGLCSPFEVPMLSALMITASWFSEIFLFKDLLITQEPTGLSKLCKSIALTIFLANEGRIKSNHFDFLGLEKAHVEIIHRLQKI